MFFFIFLQKYFIYIFLIVYLFVFSIFVLFSIYRAKFYIRTITSWKIKINRKLYHWNWQIANKSFRRQQRAQSYQICEQFVDRSTGKLLNNLSGKCLILMGCGRGTVGQIQSLAIFIFCQMYWKDGKKEKVAGSGPIEKNLMGDNVLNRFT